jgi:hypothetical protein
VPSGPGEDGLGEHGQALSTFRRAIEHGNLVAAELAARDLGRLDLAGALELTALIALHDRERGRRAALRWLTWWLGARRPTLEEAAMAVGCLAALGGPRHAEARSLLAGLL